MGRRRRANWHVLCDSLSAECEAAEWASNSAIHPARHWRPEVVIRDPASPTTRLMAFEQESQTIPPRKLNWSKARINFWLDLLLALVFVAMTTVSAVLRLVFPLPTTAAGWSLWGYDFNDLSRFHFWLLCVFGAGVVLHVMLHWSWVCGLLTRGNPTSTLRTDNGTQTLLGVLVLVVILHAIGLTVLAGMLMVVKP